MKTGLIAFLTFFCVCAFAQQVVLRVDTAHLVVGDRRNLQFELRSPAQWQLVNDGTQILDSLSWLDQHKKGKWDTLNAGSGHFFARNISFTVFDSGTFVIPALRLQWTNKQGASKFTSTDPIKLSVSYPAIDSTLAPIKDIIAEPKRLSDYLPWLWVVLASLAAIWGLQWFMRYRLRRKLAKQSILIPTLSAHEKAFLTIESLRQHPLQSIQEEVDFQTKLSYLIRQYLKDRFDFDALEASHEDIVANASKLDITQQQRNTLLDILSKADIVKFANTSLAADEHMSMLQTTEQWVNDTLLPEVITETTPEE